jgi:hypothetical protein
MSQPELYNFGTATDQVLYTMPYTGFKTGIEQGGSQNPATGILRNRWEKGLKGSHSTSSPSPSPLHFSSFPATTKIDATTSTPPTPVSLSPLPPREEDDAMVDAALSPPMPARPTRATLRTAALRRRQTRTARVPPTQRALSQHPKPT